MPKTRAELINQALFRAQLIALGQSASDQDIQMMDVLVDPAFAELAGLDIYYVSDAGVLGPSGGAIDDAAFLPLADYVASYHLVADARMQALAILAVQKLITLTAPPRTRRALSIDPALRPMRRAGTYRG